MQWTDVVLAVSSGLGVVVTGVLSVFIYRLGKRDTAEQRKEEREHAENLRRSENQAEAFQQIRRALSEVGPLLSPRNRANLQPAVLEEKLELLATTVHLQQIYLSGQDRDTVAQVYTALARRRDAPHRNSTIRLDEFNEYLNKVSVYFSRRARGEEPESIANELPIFLFWDVIEYADGTETDADNDEPPATRR